MTHQLFTNENKFGLYKKEKIGSHDDKRIKIDFLQREIMILQKLKAFLTDSYCFSMRGNKAPPNGKILFSLK